ncbi:MAG: murein biosynthesis integral membrane protein MurJ [Candidatus Levybacteria bacterium CG_4_10_14_0_8_um_filter_35_23]|nr:MAG: murein biosynthesis integral membrane protein MurJ [Candidatus Levybacteria bacterium CG_4_10_14_0_8_um_filter_35_23]
MPKKIFEKSLKLILQKQTNIISAAFVIMFTIIFSQVLGLIRQRLLVSIFGASNILGVYLASSKLPDFLFQLIIAGALSSAFIPVFSDFLGKERKEEAYKMASTLLILGLIIFSFLSLFLFIFAHPFSKLMAPGFSVGQIDSMAALMRVIIAGELLFIVGTFLSAILQSYSHFFIPGIAAALYNLGIIISIIFLSPSLGIFSAAYGVIFGALIFILVQLPLIRKVGFSFKPTFSIKTSGVIEVFKLMWPRTISIAIFQLGTIITVTLVSFLPDPGRSYVIFDYAQTLAFAPVVLFGQAIGQAAFPVLARERSRMENFKATFIASFNQMIYLVLPISVLLLVLRIPVVRLLFGAGQFDWKATVLTGRTLAFFSVSIFAQALMYLISRGFYALHDTKTPLIVGTLTTITTLGLGALFIFHYHFGIVSIAIAYSISSIINTIILFVFLDHKTGGFNKILLLISLSKIFTATFFTGFALYVPIKLLDQLVFDTTKTINLLLLTGISSFAGLSLYLFLTWLFNVSEAKTFVFLFKKIGDWKQILTKSEETIDGTRVSP